MDTVKLRVEEARATIIWTKYKKYKKGREVVRSGFGLCGAYGDVYQDGMRREPTAMESILEHQAATTFLAILILKLFPYLLPRSRHQRLIELMAIHDVVEVESGDRADDGHLDKNEKATYEKFMMTEFLKGVDNSAWANGSMSQDFMLLEAVNGLPMDNSAADSLFGQLAFLIDKMEAILQLAFFEIKNVRPNLTYKRDRFGNVTDRDYFYAHLTGSNSALDVWMAHFYDFAKSYKDFWLAKAVSDEAYYAARGKYPTWSAEILKDPQTRCWPADKS